MGEKEFQRQIIDFAHIHGWKVAHFRAGKTSRVYVTKTGGARERWVTPVSADGKGFPDLVLRRERVVWMEVKTEKGKESPEQIEWREGLLLAKQEVYLVMPSSWPEIEKVLE